MCIEVVKVSTPLSGRAVDCWRKIVPENLGVYVLKSRGLHFFTVIEPVRFSPLNVTVERRLTTALVDEIANKGTDEVKDFIRNYNDGTQHSVSVPPVPVPVAGTREKRATQKERAGKENGRRRTGEQMEVAAAPERKRRTLYGEEIRLLAIAPDRVETHSGTGMVAEWVSHEIMNSSRLDVHPFRAAETMWRIKGKKGFID